MVSFQLVFVDGWCLSTVFGLQSVVHSLLSSFYTKCTELS